MTEDAQPVAFGVSAEAIAAEVDRLGITHVICVPDSFQRTIIARWEAAERPRLVRVCTEDEGSGSTPACTWGDRTP